MAANEGYFILSRSILDSEIFASEKALKIWVWLIGKANWRDRYVSIKIGRGESTVRVGRGQLIFGRFRAEEELNINGSTIYKALKKLEEKEDIIVESNSHYTLITICNYDYYQDHNNYAVTAIEQPSEKQVTAIEQPSDTPNKDNTVKEDKEVKTESVTVPSVIASQKVFTGELSEMGQKFIGGFDITVIAEEHRQRFIDLCKAILQNFSRVLEMKEPLTAKQFYALITKHKSIDVMEVIESMHNTPALHKNYLSANLTIQKWIKFRKKNG